MFIFPHQYLLWKNKINMCEKLFLRCPRGKDGLTNRITGFLLSLANKCLCKSSVESDVNVDYKPCIQMYKQILKFRFSDAYSEFVLFHPS